MKTVLLKHLAQLYTGFTIRESIDYLDYGEVNAVQIKDLPKDSHDIDTALLTGIEWKYDSKPQFLPHNAILLVSRGEPTAYLFKGGIEDKVVASNPFIVINLEDKSLLPEFFVWYINHSTAAKSYFSAVLRGTSFPIFTLGMAKEFPIKIPPLEIQQQIIERHSQALLEKKCFEQLIQLRQEYNTALAEQLLTTN
ncbi:restriction endonuclease subunit S [Actinobacillus equuli subsp. equuli]|uniref:restriction endonuclease subunit S n=1 Tax=Actinobacillus equuli TaxID=718 RepID=UPI0024184A2B|nr:restriction endonuclease subunit S [Actinobacillus equuli]MDG4952967.1 restriction endonuclease subunit S [Actinobacillus equuli subsp. equuli]WGE50187.1 restriction endonuclease subunit S [Actinobacillus equuli subsp. haemolyticus]WGE54480.1 restriction endonuclease subunit S [Actinobacillus equuli subsp. equuli]